MALLKDRIVIVETAYHQPMGEEAVGVESRFFAELDTHNQLYERRLTVGEDWQTLDCGWLPDASMVVIKNTTGKFTPIILSPEKETDNAKRVLRLAYCSSDHPLEYWSIPPGESMRARPARAGDLMIRSEHGKAEFTVYLFPR